MKKFINKLFHFSALTSLFFQNFLFWGAAQTAWAKNPQTPEIEINFNSSKSEFKLTIETQEVLEYLLAYRTEDKTEVVSGSNQAEQGERFTREIYAGTCSENSDCLPHQVLRGIIKIKIDSLDWGQAKRFDIEKGKLEIIQENEIIELDLSDEENLWLENPLLTTEENLTASITPPDALSPIIVSDLTPTPSLEISSNSPRGPPNGHLSATILNGSDNSAFSLDLDPSATNASATLTTDKPDYTPTEIVLITGTEFNPNESYALIIISDDQPSVYFETQVTADESGAFAYAYQLDGIYRPNYTIEAKNESGEVLATTTFTDNPGLTCVNDSAGADDNPGQKDLSWMCVDYDGLPSNISVSWNWDDTMWPGGNSGDACSLYDTNGNGLADYSLCAIVEGNPATWIATVLYSCGDESAYKCTPPITEIPSFTSACSASVQADTDPFLSDPAHTGNVCKGTNCLSDDTIANCLVEMSDVGGVGIAELIDVCSYPSSEPNSNPSDCIVYRPKTGKLEVKKALDPSNDPGLFNLQINGVSYATDIGHDGTTNEQVLSPGLHNVGETAGTNTNLGNYSTSIKCKDQNGIGSIVASGSGPGPLSVNLNEDDDIVCIITNSLQQGALRVIKQVINDNGGIALASNFTIHVTSGGLDVAGSPAAGSNTGTIYTLNSGAYQVYEDTPPSGYAQTAYSGDCDSNGYVNVIPGQESVCTINNDDQAPTLTLIKTVTNDNGGNLAVADFGLFIDADSATSGVSYPVTANTQLTASETPEDGYTPSSWGGDCAGDGTITLLPGENKTCTINNDDQPGDITVCKYEDLDGGNGDPIDGVTINLYRFGLSREVDSEPYRSGRTGEGCVLFDNLPQGTYRIYEEAPIGYYQTYPTILDYHEVLLELGGSLGAEGEIYFLNALYGSIGDYIWEDLNNDTVQDPSEPAISGVTVNLYQDDGDGIFDPGGTDGSPIATDTTDANGEYFFDNLMAGDYWVDVKNSTIPADYKITTANDPLLVFLDPGENEDGADFGYVSPLVSLSLSKTNNRSSGASVGELVTYTLVLEVGEADLSSLTLVDNLPEGFIYQAGSATVDGATPDNVEPTLSNSDKTLTWTWSGVAGGTIITVAYQIQIDSDNQAAAYTNLAWASGSSDDEKTETDIVESTVPIGQGFALSASVGGVGEVLGAATGANTWLLILAIMAILSGLAIKKIKVTKKKNHEKTN